MGQRLIEVTLPRIAEELGRLNTNLEALVAELTRRREGQPAPEPAKKD